MSTIRISIPVRSLFFALFLFSAGRGQTPALDDAYRRLMVSVADEMGRSVPGLTAADFRVFIDDKPSGIKSFRPNDEPASVLFLIDDSQSMQIDPRGGDLWNYWTQSIRNFASMGNPGNEYAILTYRDQLATVLDWAKADPDVIAAAMRQYSRSQKWKNNLPLLEFLPAAIEQSKRATHAKRAILFLTDEVAPIAPRSKFNEIKELLRKEPVAIYCLNVGPAHQRSLDEASLAPRRTLTLTVSGREDRLKDVARFSGGMRFSPESAEQLTLSFGLIATALRNQYTLVIEKPASPAGKPVRKVRIEVVPPQALKGRVRLQTHYLVEYVN